MEQFRHIPGVKQYTDGLYRQQNILDTTLFGKTMINILNKRENVNLKCGTTVQRYDIDSESRYVKSVELTNGENIKCDMVINCMGPQATSHLYEHFSIILPSIAAQGYCFDLEYDDLSLHNSMNLIMSKAPYSYC